MPRPNLDDPESRAAYHAELRQVAIGWRAGGIALVVASATALVIARAVTGAVDSPLGLLALAGLVLGWALAGVGVWLRARHNARRMRERD